VNDTGERRSHPRVVANIRVRYRTLDDFVVAYTSNISQGGMFVLTDTPLPVHTALRVDLELPESDADEEGPVVPCVARVAYVSEAGSPEGRGMGLELLDVPVAIIQELLLHTLTGSSGHVGESDPVKSARILVVDDDRLSREVLTKVLSESFGEIILAENGLVALGKALESQPDLILSDVQMPGMDGWQLLRVVRSRAKLQDVPFIFLTGLKGDEERLRGYRLGVDEYLPKPVEPDELVARVKGLLLRHRSRFGGVAGGDVLRGELSKVSLTSVLSFIHQERRSGHLLVTSGRKLATIVILDGDVMNVQTMRSHAGETARERLFRVLDWSEGRFELAQSVVEADDEIGIPTPSALLEWARRKDEALDEG
jgi:uncharacterized protein (TIGR02266 family)